MQSLIPRTGFCSGTRLGTCSGEKDLWFPVDSKPAVCLGSDMLDCINGNIASILRSNYIGK